MNTSTPLKFNAVVLHSGGLDSTVALALAKLEYEYVVAMHFDYGQKHRVELERARDICQVLGVPDITVSIGSPDRGPLRPLFAGSSQTEAEIAVPEGHYEDASMRLTVVPNRNMIMLACATSYAITCEASVVIYGAHAGDHAVYPDCRREFAQAMGEAMALCDYDPPSLRAPFIAMSKAQIVRQGIDLGAPLHLSYSCYKGGPKHCGRCGTCVERREAFALAGVSDPTEYEA